jgi:hypothetical protein
MNLIKLKLIQIQGIKMGTKGSIAANTKNNNSQKERKQPMITKTIVSDRKIVCLVPNVKELE